jgi:hypothetical protein
MHAHPTLTAWQREEDGHYVAELYGQKLEVRWHPENGKVPRGFAYEIHLASGGVVSSPGSWEEMEVAMHAAEEHARAL